MSFPLRGELNSLGFSHKFSFSFPNVFVQGVRQVTWCHFTDEDTEEFQAHGCHQHAVTHALSSRGSREHRALPQAVLSSNLLAPTSNQSAMIKVRANLENQSLRSQEADGHLLDYKARLRP